MVLLGLGAGAFLVAQRPSFWLEFGVRVGQALLPRVLKYVTRRMPPEEEAAWREAERRGQGDEWLRERLRSKRKDRRAMIHLLACQPWPADHPGPSRKSSATKAVSYAMEWDMIRSAPTLRIIMKYQALH